jgi:hypothetical protein
MSVPQRCGECVGGDVYRETSTDMFALHVFVPYPVPKSQSHLSIRQESGGF